MKFIYVGITYALEFEREHKNIILNRKGNRHMIQSTYPYTTARLVTITPGQPARLVFEATVGCSPLDKYSNAKGREQALRLMCEKIHNKELKRLIWEAYRNRGKLPAPIETVH